MQNNQLIPKLDSIIQIILDAGKKIMQVYSYEHIETEQKEDKSPLTEADRAANQVIVNGIEKLSHLPILSEEGQHLPFSERKKWNEFWLVDPLDGTKEFIKRNGEFTVNIALVKNNMPILGLVYAPVPDLLYLGITKEAACEEITAGAYRIENAQKKFPLNLWELRNSQLPNLSKLPNSETLEQLKIVASKSHCNQETIDFINIIEAKFGQTNRVSSGSSLKLCMVAEGSADIYPRIAPTMEWDTAAAHAVVVAAGGLVLEHNQNWQFFPPKESINSLKYNKENLLNPYFIVSRPF